MKNSIVSYVGWLLLSAALGFYVYGIYEAIRISWPKSPDIDPKAFPEVLSTTVGSIQALLLANLGVILGISISKPDSSVARAIFLNRNTNVEISKSLPPPMDIREKIQLFGLILYIISLIACLITWIHNDFSLDSKNIISTISESGKMFIGVVLVYLTAVLGKQQ